MVEPTQTAVLGRWRDHGPSPGWTAYRATCDERGSGSVLAIGVLACVLAITAVIVPTCAALVIKQRVVAAADAAALAAADTASGLIAGVPCDAGRRMAQKNGATLARCSVDGAVATVTASSTWLGLSITVSARAGPPEAPP
jgi:helicase/secretion neighborhood TadE-like protein